MDPVSALGVASASLQFVDFSSSLVKVIIETYRLIHSKDAWKYFQLLKQNALGLQKWNTRLTSALQPLELQRQPTETEHEVLAVADECLKVSTALLRALAGFDPKDPNSPLEAARVALKAMWKKGKIDSLKQRLDAMREQLMFVVLMNIRYWSLLKQKGGVTLTHLRV